MSGPDSLFSQWSLVRSTARRTRWWRWLIGGALLVLVASAGMPFSGVQATPSATLPTTLPNGIAAGDTTATSTVLWARSTAPGPLTFEIGTAASFSAPDYTVSVDVIDPALPVKALVEGLQPGTQYLYRVTDAAGGTLTGRVRTAAPAGTRAGLRFGVSGDWRGDLAPYPAVANAAGRDLDFFVGLGDTIYADVPSPAFPGPQARTLDEFRTRHAEVYGTRYGLHTLADLRAATSVFATIDDHEVTNDFAGAAPPASSPVFQGDPAPLINDTVLFDNGLQAFVEYNPLRAVTYPADLEPRMAGEYRLYRAVTWGDDAALLLLDTRSFRDPPLPVPNDLVSNPVAALGFVQQTYTEGRTLLGQPQFDALTADLLAAEAAGVVWKFVMVPEPIQNLGVLAASDRFEGYAWERARLLRFIVQNGIRNVVFVSADIHGSLVNELVYRESPLGERVAVPAFDISTGPVAYHEPFGPYSVRLAHSAGAISDDAFAAYQAMARDAQDAYLASLLNPQLGLLQYPLLGLQDTEQVRADLVRGSYVATHIYGWTEFEIDAATGRLTVRIYGIEPYDQRELDADPARVTARQPQIVTEFTVMPQ